MRQLFIIGCPRSGTTWTMMLLGRRPEMVACMQVGIMQNLAQFRRWWAIGEKKEDNRYLNSVVLFDGPAEAALPAGGKPHFGALFTDAGFIEYCRNAARLAYGYALAAKPSARLVIDKTPENLRDGAFIAEVFPDARFLHVVRDPRSVFSSHRHGAADFGGRWPQDPLGGARYWRNDLLKGRELAQLGDRYREVKYETLLAGGSRELGGLLEWLEIPADAAWCEAAVEASSMKEMKKGVAGTPKNFFRKGSASAWREELSDTELGIIEFVNQDLMAELGYELSGPARRRPPLPIVLRDTRHRIGNIGRSLLRKVRGGGR